MQTKLPSEFCFVIKENTSHRRPRNDMQKKRESKRNLTRCRNIFASRPASFFVSPERSKLPWRVVYIIESDTGSWYVRFGLTPASTLVFGFAFGRGINWKRAYRLISQRRFASTLILGLSKTLSTRPAPLQISALSPRPLIY